jgi:hypothetical protein
VPTDPRQPVALVACDDRGSPLRRGGSLDPPSANGPSRQTDPAARWRAPPSGSLSRRRVRASATTRVRGAAPLPAHAAGPERLTHGAHEDARYCVPRASEAGRG